MFAGIGLVVLLVMVFGGFAITELQKTMTILSATQASFSKLSQLSLFDYIR